MIKLISKKNIFELNFVLTNPWKNQLSITVYGRRHLKLFINCHVSWDTLCIK